MNIIVNWIFNNKLSTIPVSKAYYFTIPAVMANTAPIDRT